MVFLNPYYYIFRSPDYIPLIVEPMEGVLSQKVKGAEFSQKRKGAMESGLSSPKKLKTEHVPEDMEYSPPEPMEHSAPYNTK